MPKCDFNISECSAVKLLQIFSAPFPKNTYEGLFLSYTLQSQALGQQVCSTASYIYLRVFLFLVLQNEKRCFLEKIILLEYLLITMLFMYTKKTSNGKEEFSKHKTIFSHHRFHSLVCHLLGKNRKWFLLPLALISQLCKLVIASL